MSKGKKYSKMERSELADCIMALVNVYGPIKIEELIDNIQYYFPKIYRKFHKEDIYEMIFSLNHADIYSISEDYYVSIFEDDEIDQLLEIDVVNKVFNSNDKKVFDKPEDILAYTNLFYIRNNTSFDCLKKFFYNLKLEDKAKEHLFKESIVVSFKMYDIQEFINNLTDRVDQPINRKELLILLSDFNASIPRGFFHGYSFREITNRERIFDRVFEPSFNNKIEPHNNYLTFKEYTYQECLTLANELKNTDIFRYFCSDNLIELLINGKKTFVQLLGYYNNDKNIIIYGDTENMLYNYQFVVADAGDYPDLANRLHYTEVILDDYGGFMTKDIKKDLEKRKYPKLPLIVELSPKDGCVLLNEKNINLVGATLESLLKIYDFLHEKIGERCEEGNVYHVIQFYLYEDEFDIGDYSNLELGDVVIPFKVDEDLSDISISAHKKIDISIGIYATAVEQEENECYLIILYDNESELIIDIMICNRAEMETINRDLINCLEHYDIRPNHITMNNSFCCEVINPLYEVYNIDNYFDVDSDLLNSIYYDCLESFHELLNEKRVLH